MHTWSPTKLWMNWTRDTRRVKHRMGRLRACNPERHALNERAVSIKTGFGFAKKRKVPHMRRVLLGEELENNHEEGCLRGSKPISKKALQNMRSQTGEKGGQVNAGSGSSRKQIDRKVKAITKHTEAYGKWPSKSVSLARWSVSSKLWARARRQHFQT